MSCNHLNSRSERAVLSTDSHQASLVTCDPLFAWGLGVPIWLLTIIELRPAAALVGGVWSHLTNFGHIWPIFIIVSPVYSIAQAAILIYGGPARTWEVIPIHIQSILLHVLSPYTLQTQRGDHLTNLDPSRGRFLWSEWILNHSQPIITSCVQKLNEEWSLQHINIKKQIQPILHYHQHVNRYIKWYKSAAIHRFANEARNLSRLGRDSRGSRERAPPWRPWWRWQQRAAGR
jgi:hypothetical protein